MFTVKKFKLRPLRTNPWVLEEGPIVGRGAAKATTKQPLFGGGHESHPLNFLGKNFLTMRGRHKSLCLKLNSKKKI